MAMRSKHRDRPRVVLADASYAREQPVAEVLEERGFRVVARPSGRNVLQQVAEHAPDVVVLDDEIVDHRPPNTIASIRAVSPHTKIVVLTDHGTMADLGADGYVIKEIPANGNITGALSELLEHRTAVPRPLPRPKARPARRPRITERSERVRALAVIVLIAAIAWLAVEAANRPAPVTAPIPHGHVAPPAPEKAGPAPGRTFLNLAFSELRDLRSSLHEGAYVRATVAAGMLMDDRAQAKASGVSVRRLDRAVTSTLEPLVAGLPPRVVAQLRDILGPLMPSVLGITVTPATTTGGTAPTIGSGSGSGGGDVTSGGGGGGGGDTTGGGGGGTTQEQGPPGGGKANGWDNKPPKGGWHHGNDGNPGHGNGNGGGP